MNYTVVTLNGKHQRALSNEEFKVILQTAIKNGWRPSAKHVRGGQMRFDQPFDAQEARDLAAALERGLSAAARFSPAVVVAVLETIGVLRHGAIRFEHHP
ncbi:MAG: hypothetical protein HC837_21300 [Chloroflexaceae bacterium]|nr:hypothetical protein [Chloroflexaceae bacterium]